MILLDTNVLSELARPRPEPRVIAWIERQPALAVSAVTLEELAFGIARAPASKRPKLAAWLGALLGADLDIFDVTREVAFVAGDLRGRRAAKGRRVAQADMLIAATAAVRRVPLATRNTRDFAGCGVTLIDPFSG
jgi:predicted nucleic acid-binding protein